MATNVLYQVVLRQQIGIVQTSQLFNYFNPAAGDGSQAFEIANQFEDLVLPSINACQGDHVENISIYVRSGKYPFSTHTIGLTGGGDRDGSGEQKLPYFLSFGARFSVVDTQYGLPTPVIKRGYKRLSGFFESDMQDRQISLTWLSTYGPDLEDAFTTNLLADGVYYAPSIHSNPEGAEDTWRIKYILGVAGWKLGTQNSRKG